MYLRLGDEQDDLQSMNVSSTLGTTASSGTARQSAMQSGIAVLGGGV